MRNLDLTISKYVPLGGAARLQLRADVFNVLNRTQFGTPNTSVTNAAFGTISTQANGPREVQLGVKIYW